MHVQQKALLAHATVRLLTFQWSLQSATPPTHHHQFAHTVYLSFARRSNLMASSWTMYPIFSLSAKPKTVLKCLPMAIWSASSEAVLVHRATLCCFWRTLTTAPQISLGSQNCSPIIASKRLSQQSSRAPGSLLLGKKYVHFPPFAHFASSHFGSIPSLKRWKSVPIINLLGERILLYRHQKSSTVLKV